MLILSGEIHVEQGDSHRILLTWRDEWNTDVAMLQLHHCLHSLLRLISVIQLLFFNLTLSDLLVTSKTQYVSAACIICYNYS